jgi:hypothetical protein
MHLFLHITHHHFLLGYGNWFHIGGYGIGYVKHELTAQFPLQYAIEPSIHPNDNPHATAAPVQMNGLGRTKQACANEKH